MRHKFYDALSYLQISELKGEIQLDAKNISINFKGTKASNMPRAPKKHASNSNMSKNRHTSCIIGALDEEDHLVLRIEGFEKEDTQMYRTLSNQIQKGSHLIGDGFQGFKTVAEELGCSLSIVKADTHISDDGYNINGINQIHSELQTFLRKFHGISTRHLQGYLNFFVLLKKLRYSYESYCIKQEKLGELAFHILLIYVEEMNLSECIPLILLKHTEIITIQLF